MDLRREDVSRLQMSVDAELKAMEAWKATLIFPVSIGDMPLEPTDIMTLLGEDGPINTLKVKISFDRDKYPVGDEGWKALSSDLKEAALVGGTNLVSAGSSGSARLLRCARHRVHQSTKAPVANDHDPSCALDHTTKCSRGPEGRSMPRRRRRHSERTTDPSKTCKMHFGIRNDGSCYYFLTGTGTPQHNDHHRFDPQARGVSMKKVTDGHGSYFSYREDSDDDDDGCEDQNGEDECSFGHNDEDSAACTIGAGGTDKENWDQVMESVQQPFTNPYDYLIKTFSELMDIWENNCTHGEAESFRLYMDQLIHNKEAELNSTATAKRLPRGQHVPGTSKSKVSHGQRGVSKKRKHVPNSDHA